MSNEMNDWMKENENDNAVLTHMEGVYPLFLPDEWVPVIEKLCAVWESYGWERDFCSKPIIKVNQIKEKFKSLRFYYELEFSESDIVNTKSYDYYDNVFRGMLCWAEYNIDEIERNRKKEGGTNENRKRG